MIEAIFLDAGGVILNESSFEIAKAEIITNIINKYKLNRPGVVGD